MCVSASDNMFPLERTIVVMLAVANAVVIAARERSFVAHVVTYETDKRTNP